MTDARSAFVYVTYIRAAPQRVWTALTDTDFMPRYWFGMSIKSDWRAGAAWRLENKEGKLFDSGEILEFEPPSKLVLRWTHQSRPELTAEGPARCTMTLEPYAGATKLTILHEIERPASKLIEAVSGGWPRILSNLKSLLETGDIALT